MTTVAVAADGAMRLFVPITKVDAAKRLVYGQVAAEVVDKANEIMDYESAKPNFEAWSAEIAKNSDGKSLGNVRAMHGSVAAGKLTALTFDDPGKQIECCAKIVDDGEWAKVEEGVYTGFSLGGRYEKRWKDPTDPTVMRYTPTIAEVSIVDNPAIPTATFSYIKADGGTELRKFAAVTAPADAPAVAEPPTNDEVVARAVKLAGGKTAMGEIAPFLETAKAELVAERSAAAAKAVVTAPANGTAAAPAAASPAAAPVAKNTAEDGEQVWKSNRDGSTHPTKAALRAHNLAVDAAASAAKAAAPAVDALRGLKDALDKSAPVTAPAAPAAAATPAVAAAVAVFDAKGARKDFPADRLQAAIASGAAFKDGAWPIETAEDVTAALAAFKDARLPEGVRRHVVRRARALKAPLPEALADPVVAIDKSAGAADLAKSANLYLVTDMIGLLASLEGVEERYESSDYWGGYVQPDSALATRFGALVVEAGDIVAAILDQCLSAMRDEESSEALTRGAMVRDLVKAGARHSKGDLARVQKVHDLAEELGAMCGSDTGKVAKAAVAVSDDVAKITAERDGLTKVLTELAPQIVELTKRVATLERTPARPDAPTLRLAEKTADNGGDDGGSLPGGKLLKDATPDELATHAIKIAQRRPVALVDGRFVGGV